MTFLDPLILRGRARAEAVMHDEVTVKRESTSALGANMQYTPTYTTLYDGKARIHLATTVANIADAGERTVTSIRTNVDLPITAEGIQVGDIVTVTTSVYDADMVDNTYRVSALHAQTHGLARRLECEEVQP